MSRKSSKVQQITACSFQLQFREKRKKPTSHSQIHRLRRLLLEAMCLLGMVQRTLTIR